jgi:pimeloyl-ACP methyl ester carboxylesterase
VIELNAILAENHATITYQSVKIHYESYMNPLFQNKPVLILIHGFLSSTFSFRKLIPYLTKHYSVIAIDLPPFGKSQKCRRFIYSYENFAKIIEQLIEDLQIERSVLIGHSMGGQIALQVSKRRPDLIDKMVLLCSSSYLERAKPHLFYSSYLPFFSLILKNWLKRKGIRGNLSNVVYDKTLIDEVMINGYMQPFIDENIFRSLTRMIRDREGDLRSEEIKQIETPSLLIWGKEDRVVPLHIGKQLHTDLPNSELVVYNKTAHLLPEENAKDVYQDILNFL